MILVDVHITNWKKPGDEWWKNVQDNPDSPSIDADLKIRLMSWNDYQSLLAWIRNRDSRKLHDCDD